MTAWENNCFFTWDIHYKCSYDCKYCFLKEEPQTTSIKSPYISVSEWIRIWKDFYSRYGKAHISVTGGEPFDYPDFIDIVAGLINIHTFEFSTNLSWDVKKFVSKVPYNRVIINSSFHPDHVTIEEFVDKLIFLRERKYSVSVTVVAYPPYIERLIDYSKKFHDKGFPVIIFPFRGHYLNKKYPESYSEEEIHILKKLGVSIGSKVSENLMDSYKNALSDDGNKELENKVVKCYMGMRYAKIVPNGDAYRCCSAVGKDWGKLGNIINRTFKFYDLPMECYNLKYCVCYKAMIKDKDGEKWKREWIVPDE